MINIGELTGIVQAVSAALIAYATLFPIRKGLKDIAEYGWRGIKESPHTCTEHLCKMNAFLHRFDGVKVTIHRCPEQGCLQNHHTKGW